MSNLHKEDVFIAATDLSRWRLKVDHGKQTWHYLESDDEVKDWPQSLIDKYWLGLPFVSIFFSFQVWKYKKQVLNTSKPNCGNFMNIMRTLEFIST